MRDPTSYLPVNLFAPSVSARPAPHKHPQLYSILCTPDAPHAHTHSFASTTNSRPPTSDLACICADRRLRQHQHDLRHHPMFSGTMVFGVSPAGSTHLQRGMASLSARVAEALLARRRGARWCRPAPCRFRGQQPQFFAAISERSRDDLGQSETISWHF